MSGAVAWAVLCPLGTAVATVAVGNLRTLRALAVLGAVLTLASTLQLAWGVHLQGALELVAGGWRPPLGIRLRADGLSAVLLPSLGVVSALCLWARWDELRGGLERARSVPAWFFAWAALDALLLSADLFNLYVALELTSLSAVALIASDESASPVDAALSYLLASLPGSLTYLLGVGILYGEVGVLDLTTLAALPLHSKALRAAGALMAVGLSLKAALFPLHAWLPQAYREASPATGAFLSGVLGKAPFLVLARCAASLAGADRLGGTGALALLGGLSLAWAALLAFRARRALALVAWSSISQAGYLFLVFDLSSAAAWHGAVLLAVSHALAAPALFLSVGVLRDLSAQDRVAGIRGLARAVPVAGFSLGLAALTLVGLPPSGGFLGKWLLLHAAFAEHRTAVMLTLLLGGLLTAAYAFRLVEGAFARAQPAMSVHSPHPVSARIALTLSVASVATGVLPAPLLALLSRGGGP